MSQSKEDRALVRLANDMLTQLHVSTRVRHLCDINAGVFLTLFEGLCGEKLPDVIRRPLGREDEIHNCKCVIDTLSMDILNTSLSHITGEDVVDGDQLAIGNLLEVFHGLLEYIMDRIGSDISSDADEDIHLRDLEDPDLVTPEVIDDILERELGRGYRTERSRSSYRRDSDRSDNTDELIALGQVSRATQSGSSANNTADVVALGDSRYLPSSGSKRGHRRRQPEDSRSGNLADVSSELHTDTSCEQQRRRGEVSAHTWPSTIAPSSADVSASRLSHTAPTASVSAVSQPPLNQSNASSMSMPQPLTTQDFHRANPGEFSSIGLRPHPDSFSASLPAGGTSEGRPGTHHTFTHHLYHHYNTHTAHGLGRPSTDFSSSLPVPSAVATLLQKEAQGHQRHTLPSALASSNLADPYVSSLSDGHIRPTTTSVPASVSATQRASDSYGQSAGSSRLYDTVDTAELMKSLSSQGTKTAGGQVRGPLADSTDAELSEALRTTLNKMKEDAQLVDRLVRTHVNDVQSGDNLRPRVTPDPAVQGILSPGKRQDKSQHKVSFQKARSAESSVYGEQDTVLGERGTVPGEEGLLSRSNGHSSSGAGRPWTGGEDRNRTTSSLWSSETTGSTALSANELAARRQLSDPSLDQDGRRNVGPRRQENVPPRTFPENVPPKTLPENVPPRTFQEYLQKYYAQQPSHASRSDDESSYYSDGVVDYGDSGEEEEDGFEAAMQREVGEMKKKAKSVRFDDILDCGALGQMGGIRRSLLREDQRCRLKTQYLDKVYRDELKDYKSESAGMMKKSKKNSKKKEQEFKKKTTGGRPVRSKVSSKTGGTKSVLLPRQRGRTRSVLPRDRKRSASASPTVGTRQQAPDSDTDMLPWLLSEFPFLYLSPETVHDLWRKSSRQLELMSRAESDVQRKKSKAQVEIEEAERRQKVLLDIMKKELAHNQRMRELKARQAEQQAVKARIRDKRQQSTRIRRYYNDYQVQMRSKMLKKRTKEEQVFKKLFRDGLDIQKERIRELRRYAREQREHRAERHHADLVSLENYYKDQFSMLSESLAKEKADTEVRDKAQARILEQMKKELRKKMEKEVKDFQEQLCRDDDDAYFRQIDADRLRHQLQMSRYQVQI